LILTLQTTTFSQHGGIPTYNRLICRSLNDMPSAYGSQVLIATDNAEDIAGPAKKFTNLNLHTFKGSRFAIVRRLIHLMLTQRLDLLLLGHVNYGPIGLFLRIIQPKMRYGVILYGIDGWQTLPPLRLKALRAADFIISISDYTKQRAVEVNGLLAERFHLLPNSLEMDGDSAPPAPSEVSTITGTRLLSVCRLEQTEQYKGVEDVIAILPDVAKQVPDIQYFVIGDGTDLERHKQLANQLGVGERVHFLGFVDEDTLRACYRDADIFILPSGGEGFGFVFLEAMQYAKPVIAADSGGAPEVVVDDVTGRLVEYGNRPQLLQALSDLCLNKAERERMGTAGYQRLQANFTYSHFKKTFSNILLQECRSSTALRKLAPSVEELRQDR
jgi:phosphatidyl-myo-inositol dimannoside synthase